MSKKSISIVSLLVSMSGVQISTAALGTLVALKIAAAGASQEAASLIAAGYSFGFLVGCFFIFRPLAEIGHIRAFAAGAAICALFTLLVGATENITVLIVARLITGLATAGLFAIGDAWINDSAVPSARGRTLAIYYFTLGMTSVVSQLFVAFYSGDLSDAFVIMAALYCSVIVVMAGTRTQPPKIVGEVALRVRAAFAEAPTAIVGVFVSGFVLALLTNVMPYQGAVIGLSSQTVALAVATLYLGRSVSQIPIGRISDRFDRRYVIVSLSTVSAIILALFSIFAPGDGSMLMNGAGLDEQIIIIVGACLLGGAIMPLYSVLVSYALDRTTPSNIGSTAITTLFVYTLGGVLGPLIASVTSAIFGDDSLYNLCFFTMAGLAVFAGMRIPGRPRALQTDITPSIVATTTSVAMPATSTPPEQP